MVLQCTVLNKVFLLGSSSVLFSDSLTISRGMKMLFNIFICGFPCKHLGNVSL